MHQIKKKIILVFIATHKNHQSFQIEDIMKRKNVMYS